MAGQYFYNKVDSHITGGTWTPNQLVLNSNLGNPSINVSISEFSALTISDVGIYNNIASGSNINELVNWSSLIAYASNEDFYVTGGTFSQGALNLDRNDGQSILITGFTSDDFFTTGATLFDTNIVFNRNDLINAYSVDLKPVLENYLSLSGGFINGDIELIGSLLTTGDTYINGQLNSNSVSAVTFYGDGSNLTNIVSSNLTIGSTQINSGATGNILFQSGTTLQQSSNLFWDTTNSRLKIGNGASTTNATISIRHDTGSAGNVLFEVQNGQYANSLFKITDNRTSSIETVGAINVGAKILNFNNRNVLDLGGYGLGATYGENSSNIVLLNESGNLGDAAGSMVLAKNNNLFINTITTKQVKFDKDGNVGIGNVGALGARLDVRAQGALSTDLAFRIRNNADTINILDVRGDGGININNDGAAKNIFVNSTGSIYTSLGSNFVVNSVSTLGDGAGQNVLINATTSGYNPATRGLIFLNTNSPYTTKVGIGRIDLANSGGIYVGSDAPYSGNYIRIGNNVNTGTNAVTIGNNMAWPGGGDSGGMFAIGSNLSGIVNDHANAFVFGINRKDLVIGGGKGNLGVGGFNPTSRAETNTLFQVSGTAPVTSIVDGYQLYSADRGGVGGKAAAHFRSEDGTVNVIGDLSGFGSSNPQARLDVRAQGALSTDVVFRVRNNADDTNLLDVRGNGTMNFNSVSGPITFTEGSSGGFGQGIVFKRGTNSATFSLDNSSALNLNTGGMNINSNSAVIVLNGGPSGGSFFQSVDLRGNGNQSVRINSTGQCVFGPSTTWYNGDGGYTYTDRVIVDRQSMAFRNATTIPTTTLDSFKFYSADITAGNAAPHFRTENGRVVKLYQQVEAALVNTANTGDANTDTLIEALKTIIINAGLGAAI